MDKEMPDTWFLGWIYSFFSIRHLSVLHRHRWKVDRKQATQWNVEGKIRYVRIFLPIWRTIFTTILMLILTALTALRAVLKNTSTADMDTFSSKRHFTNQPTVIIAQTCCGVWYSRASYAKVGKSPIRKFDRHWLPNSYYLSNRMELHISDYHEMTCTRCEILFSWIHVKCCLQILLCRSLGLIYASNFIRIKHWKKGTQRYHFKLKNHLNLA